MGIDGENLKHVYESWGKQDLVKAVTIDKKNYEPSAIDIMKKELQKRGVSNQDLATFQDSYSSEKSQSAEFYYNRGITYYKKGQYDQAILDYTKALEINPRHAKAYCNRGVAYGEKGIHDQAISDFNNALEIDPRYAEAYYNRGVAYREKGQYDQAISDYTKALEINPRHAGAYYDRGVAYYFKREYEKSWKNVKKAQSLGDQIHPEFLDNLRKASGRQN